MSSELLDIQNYQKPLKTMKRVESHLKYGFNCVLDGRLHDGHTAFRRSHLEEPGVDR